MRDFIRGLHGLSALALGFFGAIVSLNLLIDEQPPSARGTGALLVVALIHFATHPDY